MNPVCIIAEIAQSHDGSLGIAHSYIEALAHSGVDAIKFQTHIAEAESSGAEEFRFNFSYEDATRYDYWKRMEFTPEQWAGLKEHCDEKGVEFISSPFSVAAVELLERIGVKRYKVGSGELNNYLMLHKIAETSKDIIISSGMSDWEELDNTIDFLTPYGNSLTLLQCTTAYPTEPKQWGLDLIPKLQARYGLPVGYSDHSANKAAPIASVALGATTIEFHAVFHREMFGPDSKASLTIEEIKDVVTGIRSVSQSLSAVSLKEDSSVFDELKFKFGKSLAVNKSLFKGHVIKFDDLESKKPAMMGISPIHFKKFIGKKLSKDKLKWDFLSESDFE